jgi:RNA ligase
VEKHIEDIKHMVINGNFPDTVSVKENGELVLLNYKAEVQFDNAWTPVEIACRGLIVNRITGEIVARPFEKFFNWGENNRATDAPVKTITEKMDGSLGILYRNGSYKIATRGSFESDQALWATDFLYKRYGDTLAHIPCSWTPLFEIIYPDNRIVIDYGNRHELVLLAIRNRHTGEYLDHSEVEAFGKQHGFGLPKVFRYNGVDELLGLCSEIDANNEGWVVEFEDGQRFKFKGDEYKKIHKLISGLSFKFVLENHAAGTLQHALGAIPDEFKDEVKEWERQIDETIEATKESIESAFAKAPKDTRKDYALWCKSEVPNLLPYMFARLDNKDVAPIIYKCAF